MVVVAVRGVGTLGAELRDLHLTFVDDRTVVQLAPLNDGFATHVYLSRLWANAQEQSGVIKGLLVTMLPTCKVYLNEDDDDDEVDVEEQVHIVSRRVVHIVSRSRCTHSK